MSRRGGRRSGWAIFRWPILLALVTVAGLVAALVGDGAWDWLGTAALLAPVAIVAARLAAGDRKPSPRLRPEP